MDMGPYWGIVLAFAVLMSLRTGNNQTSLGKGMAMLLSPGIASIPVAMATLSMGPPSKNKSGWGRSKPTIGAGVISSIWLFRAGSLVDALCWPFTWDTNSFTLWPFQEDHELTSTKLNTLQYSTSHKKFPHGALVMHWGRRGNTIGTCVVKVWDTCLCLLDLLTPNLKHTIPLMINCCCTC